MRRTPSPPARRGRCVLVPGAPRDRREPHLGRHMGTRTRRRTTVALAILLSLTLAACRSDVTGIVLSPHDGQMQDFGTTTTVSGVIPASYPEGGVLKVQGVDTPYAPLASDPN